ncbi:PREDICTED: uncharacterized protein LOC109591788 [Amphimedon queenslandica]|uniref:Caspase family p20 domain-containing protein n=1 Tax=Amphimedon queenslandica TaxID=400682 RepID=A0A1X7VMD3_AMPQE|nr:PREDICTED: uncharacterized protein LOC109591788 [Amphimedon queenslandica]|eukprot:XP_019862994.1 PREDICTED: uncharacterized protein LOC109591788 [Amphimedon queenslandica]
MTEVPVKKDQERTVTDRRNINSIRFAIIIDNCGEAKIEEDGTRKLNEQAKALHEVLEGSGFCVLYLNNLSSATIDNFLRAFKNDVDHSQLSMFALIFLSKGMTPQLYDANNTVVPFEKIFQYFYDDQSPLSEISKVFFFDIAYLDDENKSQPTLPDYPSNSLALAIAHNDPDFSFAVETLAQCFNQKSIQDIFATIQEMNGSKTKENGNIADKLIIDKLKNICLGDHLLLLRSLWYPIRTETVDVILKNKDEVMSIVRNERLARIATSVAGAVIGGSLTITGIALAPFTFGASIGVSVAGGAVGALASAGGIGAFIVSKVLANKRLKYAQEHIVFDQQLSLTINEVAKKHEKEVHANKYTSPYSQFAGFAAAGSAMGIADASRIGAGVAIATEGAVEGAALALRTGGRVAGMVLAGVSLAVTVPLDVGFIAYHSYNIHKSNKDKSGRADNNKVIKWLISQAEEMLKGMCIKIDAKKHEITGGQIAFCNGIEYGYKIHIPLAPANSFITVHTIFSGPIALPEGYTLVSAMYDIKLPVGIKESATITLDHCVDVNDVSIAKDLCFATATLDIMNRVLPFSPVSNEGVFWPGETSGSITRKESCFLCILYKGPLELMKYTALVQQLQENFDITFFKNLKPHLKFSQQRLSIDSDYLYQFRFATVPDGDEQAVKLSNCRDIIETKGWTVTPIGEIPQTIEKKEIDTLELQPKVWKLQNEIFPTIHFHTGYNDEMDPPEEHPLVIDGIVPDKPILLKRPRRMH